MYLFNIDTIYFYLDFADYNSLIEKYISMLDCKKDIAKEHQIENDNTDVIVELGGKSFKILPNGVNFHAYILQNDDLKIYLSCKRSRGKENYPVKIELRQELLWSCPFEKTYSNLIEYFTNILDKPINEKLSRVDLCCHTDEIDFTKITKDDFRSRATKKCCIYTYDVINCFEFGTRASEIYCRIYNKSLEIIEKNKLWFNDIWQSNGVNVNSDVWNVEFELKRDFLNNYELNTVDELLNQINSIWCYLVNEWLVLVNKDRTRKENCSTNECWKQLYIACKFDLKKKFIRKEKINEANDNVLITQINGLLSSYAANNGIYDMSDAVSCMYAQLAELDKNGKNTFASVVQNKMKLNNKVVS